ncbi:hypothetical protein PRIC1_011013 [Phytophthora ramorum]
MPVQYSSGVLQSHLHTREQGKASLFDVSHMGQLRITGADRLQFLEQVVVGALNVIESVVRFSPSSLPSWAPWPACRFAWNRSPYTPC